MKKLLLVLSTFALIGCAKTQERNESAKVIEQEKTPIDFCLEKIVEKGKYDNFAYTYTKLISYNYDYHFERTKENSEIDCYFFTIFEKEKYDWLCFVETFENETINVLANKIY